MVDPVGTITKVVEVALKIKRAAATVKQNEDLCKQIKERVEIISNTLSQHRNNTGLMSNLAVRAALGALEETLDEALELVMECQQEINFVCLLYTAGNLSQQLIKVEQRISNKNSDAMFAILGFLLAEGSRRKFQVYSPMASRFQAMQPPNPPKQMWRPNQDGGDVNAQTDDDLYGAIFNRVRADRSTRSEVDIQVSKVDPVTSNSQWDSSMEALCSCCAMAKKRKPVRRPSSTPDGQPRSLLQQIAEVALDVEEASETVLQYKEVCIEIEKRASRVSSLLSDLENTEMVEEQALKDELNKLLETFRSAHTLVMVCQRSSIVTTFVCSPPCKLSKELSALLDRLVPHVNAIIAVIVNCTLRPERVAGTRNPRFGDW